MALRDGIEITLTTVLESIELSGKCYRGEGAMALTRGVEITIDH
jgi:hypothetical protein